MTKEELVEIVETRYSGNLLLALDYVQEIVETLRNDPQLTAELIERELERRGWTDKPEEGELFIGNYEYKLKTKRSMAEQLRNQIKQKLEGTI